MIKHLESLLSTNKSIIDQKIQYLTDPGDNYGSLMLRVDLTLQTPEGNEDVHVVAKTPPANQLMREMFNTQITFRNEIWFYKEIIPILQEFQRENEIENVISFAPKYYGSRFNLNGVDDHIDEDAVLLLENLKVSNFVNFERTEGFDLDVAKLILTDLAYLHAVPIGLKLKKPELFKVKVRPYLRRLHLTENFNKNAEERLIKIFKSTTEIQPFLDRVLKVSFADMYPAETPREPFATISHNDCWVNNTMQLLDKDGKVTKTKLVDFQVCDYGSCAKDVIFFIFTSLKMNLIEEHCDQLIDFYFEKFLTILDSLKVDTGLFPRDLFDKEVKYEAWKSQLPHVLLMFFPIFAPKGSVADFSDLNPAKIATGDPTPAHLERIVFVVKEFARRNWI